MRLCTCAPCGCVGIRVFLRVRMVLTCSACASPPPLPPQIIARQVYESLSVREAAATIRADGLRMLFRGVGPPLIQKATSIGVMYGM